MPDTRTAISKNIEKQDILFLNEEQREAVTESMVRLEIMEALPDLVPCSVSELAKDLGRTPQSLYYHVEILTKAGLINQVGSRRAGKRDEAVYDLPAKWVRFVNNNDPNCRDTLFKLAHTILRLAEKNYQQAYYRDLVARVGRSAGRSAEGSAEGSVGGSGVGGEVENIYLRRQRGRLTDEALRKVYEHIHAIGELFENGKAAGEGNKYSLSAVLAPLEPHIADGSEDLG